MRRPDGMVGKGARRGRTASRPATHTLTAEVRPMHEWLHLWRHAVISSCTRVKACTIRLQKCGSCAC
eukprot:12277578-Alexandrium_andersonii.AAC.1